MGADQELLAIFRVEVEEQIDALCERLRRGPERWRIDRLFQVAHNVKGAAGLVGADEIRDAAHALEDLFSAIREGLELSPEAVRLARSGAELLDASFRSVDGGSPPELGAFRQEVDACIGAAGSSPQPQAAPSEVLLGGEDDDEPERPESDVGETGKDTASTLRISSNKLDALLGVTSELVTHVFSSDAHATLARSLASQTSLLLQKHRSLQHDPTGREVQSLAGELSRALRDHADDALRISEELLGSARALRMVPIDSLRTLLNRSVRGACEVTGKSAVLRVSGGGTEVDRGMLEHLRDPLVHLIRNAIVHGIEEPEERLAAGKGEIGAVDIRAGAVGSWVEIEVSDDGQGIDLEKVHQRALSSSAITRRQVEALDEDGVLNLLFEPGLSTVDSVSELAGRGVGLDVVKSNVSRLGGSSAIHSKQGQGTTVVLRVPLTRLTTSGVLIRVAGQTLAIPTADVESTLRVSREDVAVAEGHQVVRVGESQVPLGELAELLSFPNEQATIRPVVVLTDGERRRAFLIDEVVGQREYVLQLLPWNLQDWPWLAGSAVLDGGEVVLVLDSRALIAARQPGGTWDGGYQARQRRLLVVDDSATSRTLVRNILRAAGYHVQIATDGEQALAILRKEEIDLVVSDVEMPRLDGLELTTRVRRELQLERLPVILVTNLDSEDHRQRGAAAGADAYIVKGAFDQDELLRAVARLL